MCKHLTSYLRSKLRSPQPPPHTSTNSQKGGDLYFISSFQRSYLRSRSSCFQLLPVARDASAVGVGDRHGDRRRARAEALSRLSNNERQVSQQTENCFKFQAMFQAKQQPASNIAANPGFGKRKRLYWLLLWAGWSGTKIKAESRAVANEVPVSFKQPSGWKSDDAEKQKGRSAASL